MDLKNGLPGINRDFDCDPDPKSNLKSDRNLDRKKGSVHVFGITGGIATGKSSFSRLLAPLLGAALFDADAVARELLSLGEDSAEAAEAIAQVRAAFGREVERNEPPGGIDRAKLREIVFADPERRKRLESILHPMIRARWTGAAESARQAGTRLVVDIPLLFEQKLEEKFDTVLVVACRAATQRARIVSERGLSEATADRILAAQESLASKMARAAHVVWSDAPPARLQEQAEILAGFFQNHAAQNR